MVTVTEPGVYPGLDRKDWPAGLSASGAKDILKAPAIYKWRREHPHEDTPATATGTVVHALTLGTPRCWETIAGGRGVTERREAARAKGLVSITLDELAVAARMAAAILNHPQAREVLDYCTQREVAVMARDPETGTWMRGQIDALGPRLAVDVKTVKEGAVVDFARHAINYGYDVQAAVYGDMLAWLGRPVESVVFVLVEKAEPYLVAVRLLDDEFVALGRRKMRRAIDLYVKHTESGDWPGYEPYDTVSAPRWAL
jgi:hypothetical protein